MRNYSDKECYDALHKKNREITNYFLLIKDDLDFVPSKEKLLEFDKTQRRSLYYMCENQIYDYVNGIEDIYTNPDKKSVYDKMCERSHKLELLIEDIDCHDAYSYMFGEFNHIYTEDDFKDWSEQEAHSFMILFESCCFEYDELDDYLREIPRRVEIYNRMCEQFNNCKNILEGLNIKYE